MPRYLYNCSSCSVVWEEQRLIADRAIPTQEACPFCAAETGIELVPAAPAIGDPMRLGVRRAPDAFNDVLKNIKKNHYKSTIQTR